MKLFFSEGETYWTRFSHVHHLHIVMAAQHSRIGVVKHLLIEKYFSSSLQKAHDIAVKVRELETDLFGGMELVSGTKWAENGKLVALSRIV